MGVRVNLGCGPIYVESEEWVNLDYSLTGESVKKADLLRRLPFPEQSVSLVYSSHFLEHVPRTSVPAFLKECYRILEPDGRIRLVLPDLENMAREYLSTRESGEDEKANFVVMEIVDQCVRLKPGGELGKCYNDLLDSSGSSSKDMIAYVRERTGENLLVRNQPAVKSSALHRLPAAILRRLERLWIKLVLLALPSAFRSQNVSLANVGEKHHWLWDFSQLRDVLRAEGFVEVQRQYSESSSFPDFPFYPLDVDSDGMPRKGYESMYVEASKPL